MRLTIPLPFTTTLTLCLEDFGRHEFEFQGTYYPAATLDEDAEIELYSLSFLQAGGTTEDWTGMLDLLDPEVKSLLTEKLEEELDS
jgi:hypothetical protein